MIGERHSFRGYADTLLSWDEMNSQWRIQLYSDPSVYATLRSFEYPFGTADWEVFGDDCSDLSMQIVSLNINACSDRDSMLVSPDSFASSCQMGLDSIYRLSSAMNCSTLWSPLFSLLSSFSLTSLSLSNARVTKKGEIFASETFFLPPPPRCLNCN